MWEITVVLGEHQEVYPPWWTTDGLGDWYRELPEEPRWNCYICAVVLVALVWVIAEISNIYIDILDVIYNLSYAFHVFAIGYKLLTEMEYTEIKGAVVVSFIIDMISYSHFASKSLGFKLFCYFLRLHRPFRYLFFLNDFHHKGSVLGTTLKFCYIFFVLRVILAWIWLHVEMVERTQYPRAATHKFTTKLSDETQSKMFLTALYIINKMFIPIGASVTPDNDVERLVCILIMIAGCVVVGGAAVATLSLVFSLYMRPEESFRARYRLIMKDMKDSRVSQSLVRKVETFYNMYWQKQRAVSRTSLLPIFPPTLPTSIYTDVYFEATQKARMLRQLDYQMLSEVSKQMETVHYIPGDSIIQRGTTKSSIIYITYGDIEMLTAEDDSTALVRMTRGTLLTAASGAAAAACAPAHVAVRAATFCTAHVLPARHLWRALTRHSVTQDHAGPVLAAFNDHIERVKRHYMMKEPDDAIYKSSILKFNRNLMDLKELRDDTGKVLLADRDIFLEVAGCYIMRNSAHLSLTDESDEICLRSTFPYILQPSSSLLVAWHSLVALLILIVCITHPYYLVFIKNVPLEFRFFDYMVTTVFVIDLVVHLSTGTNLEEGGAITFGQTSSQQMRSHWFVLDVLATFPIFEFCGEGHFAGINKILRLPNVFRVLKSLEETYVYHSNFIRFMSYSFLLVIACYLIAALQQSFMCFQSGYCQVTNLTHSPYWEKKPMDQETVQSRLSFGLYWSISMLTFTTHKETWGKENWNNVLYTMGILEVCIVLRIFMEAVYSATIMVTTTLREEYDSLIATVKKFLIRNQIDPELRNRFMTYLQLCWYTDKAYKITHRKTYSIFYDLPSHVYQDIVGKNRIKYLLCIPFMRLLKTEELKTVSSAAAIFYTSPNEILLNTGDLSNEMYIIKKGICEIICPVTKKSVGGLSAKNHFGAVICLLRLPSYYTVRAVTHVQVLCISRKNLISALLDNVVTDSADFVKSLPEYQRLTKRYPSFLTYTPPPPIPNRMFFRLPMKHESDAEFLYPFTRLGFLSILRYVFPRFTIRPDGKYLIRYELFRVACAVISAMTFPAYTYLVLQWSWLYYFTLLLDISAWFDIFQRMLIGYFNEYGILVYHPASTAAYYMKGSFIMDLFGCLPLENLESARKEIFENRYRVTPTKQLLMMNRLLQLYRFPSAMLLLKEYFERRDLIMVIQVMPIMIPLLNALVSLMIYSSVSIYYTVDVDDDITDFLIVPFNDPGGSWINLFAHTFRFNLTNTPWNLHLATYFWITYECTTVGYNSIGASNFHLLQLLLVGIICSTMIMTYFSVRIISIRANVNTALAGFQQHMKDIDFFMKKENLDEELQKEIHRYYEYNWEKMGGINYRGMLKLCDQITLRTDAILHIYGHTFDKCPLLSQADVSLLRMLGRAIRSVYFLRDMKIIEHDDVVHDIYFVDYGGVEARMVEDFGDLSTCIRLPRGSVFGNLHDSKAGRYPLNIIATSRLHLLIIKTAIFYSIIKDFPSVRTLLDKYRNVDSPVINSTYAIFYSMDLFNFAMIVVISIQILFLFYEYYILGNISQAVVKLRRDKTETNQRTRKGFIKTIYYQDGLVQIYLITISIACIYADVYNAGFQDNRLWLIYSLYVLDLCFFLKIIMQLVLPLLVNNKNIKRILLPIRQMYFKKEFKYDMLSCVPFELLSFASIEHRWMLFSWFRLNRMFRIVTVYKCLKRRNERITVNLTTFAAAAGSIWFSLFVHTITCVWYFIGLMIDRAREKTSWMYSDDGRNICDNTYICSLYFIITTVSQNGIGDILPRNRTEVVYVIIIQIISMLMLMVYVGEFSNIVQRQSFRSFNFFSKYLELQEYLKNNRVSSNLVRIVNKYTLHLWRETRGQQVPKFLTDAPASLRLRVMSNIYQHHVARHHIFEDCEPGFMRQLVGCLRLFTYNEGMYVVKESEITNSMYLIHTGKIKETRENKTVSTRIYPAGSYFGILQGLLRDSPYTHSYQTVIKSQVLTLNLDDWEYLLDHYPLSRHSIYKHMTHVASKDVSSKRWPGGGPSAPSNHPPPPGGGGAGTAIIHNIPPGKLRRTQSTTHTRQSTHIAFRPTAGPSGASPPQKLEESLEREVSSVIDPDENQRKVGLIGRINRAARKIMEKFTDTDELNYAPRTSSETKDELLLEEEEDATLALLKQYDEATRRSKAFRRKSSQKLRKVIEQAEEREREENAQGFGTKGPRPSSPGDKTARFASLSGSSSQVKRDILTDNAMTGKTVDYKKNVGTDKTIEQTNDLEMDIEKIRGTYDATIANPSSELSVGIGSQMSQDSITSIELKSERPSQKRLVKAKTPTKSKTTRTDNKEDENYPTSLQSLKYDEGAISHDDVSEKLDDTKPESLVNVIDLEKNSHDKIKTTPDSLPESLIAIKDLDQSDSTKEVSETEKLEYTVSIRESLMAVEDLEKSESFDAKNVVNTKTVAESTKSNQDKKITQLSPTPSKEKLISSWTTVYEETDNTDRIDQVNLNQNKKTVDESSKRDKEKLQLQPTPSFEEEPIHSLKRVHKSTDYTDKGSLSNLSQSEKTVDASSQRDRDKKIPTLSTTSSSEEKLISSWTTLYKETDYTDKADFSNLSQSEKIVDESSKREKEKLQLSPNASLRDNPFPPLTRVRKETDNINKTGSSQSEKTVDEGDKTYQDQKKLQLSPAPSFKDSSIPSLARDLKETDNINKTGPSVLSHNEKTVDEDTEREQNKKKRQLSPTPSFDENSVPPLARDHKEIDYNDRAGPSRSDREKGNETSEQRESRRVRYKEKESSILDISRMDNDASLDDVLMPQRAPDKENARGTRKRSKIQPKYDTDDKKN